MARSYSRIASSIWRDGDFVALPPEQKLTYLMLISQPDVSPCGLLSVTVRRWATSLGMTSEELVEALDGLAKALFVVWDPDAEELLIRSFVKWDGGLGNENRAKAIIASVEVIRSDRVFNKALVELSKLRSSHGLASRPERPANVVQGDFERASDPVRTDSEGPRVVVKKGEWVEPQPLDLIPAQPRSREPDRFDEFWSAYPRRVAKQAARRKWDTLVARKVNPDTIIQGAQRYATEVRGKDPQFVKQPDGWLNAGRWEDEPEPPSPRPSTPWAGA